VNQYSRRGAAPKPLKKGRRAGTRERLEHRRSVRPVDAVAAPMVAR